MCQAAHQTVQADRPGNHALIAAQPGMAVDAHGFQLRGNFDSSTLLTKAGSKGAGHVKAQEVECTEGPWREGHPKGPRNQPQLPSGVRVVSVESGFTSRASTGLHLRST